MQRFLALFLAFCLLCGIMPLFASAEDFFPEELLDEFLIVEELVPEDLPETPAENEALPEEFLPPILEETELPLMEELIEQEANLAGDDKALTAFVERSYSLILGRSGDKGGVEYWVNTLKSGTATGADIVDSFCRSGEFTGKNYSDTEKIEILYRTMMDRAPDSGGVAYWKGFLDNGLSFHYVINGFASSEEFKGICSSYGINAGSVALENRDRNPSVTMFVNRCYEVALGRSGDADGLNGWTGNLLSNAMTAQEVSYAFLFSAEFEAKGYSNDAFVTRLYKLYMNRDPDAQGKSGWVSQLSGGMTRKRVAQGFANSAEFEAIVRSYGLDFTAEKYSIVKAPSPDAPLSRENILALLDAYDPDGAFIVRNSDESWLLGWFDGYSTIGRGSEKNLEAAVHEQCHDFTHSAGWRSEYIYIGDGNYIEVPFTQVFDSIEMVPSIPESLRTFRFNTYINTDEWSMTSRQHGVYGLLDEFTAYCWGNNNDIVMFDYYTENGLLNRYSAKGSFFSYAEFRYYILHYMLYAKEHHPDVYEGILNNSIFKTAFTSVDTTFRNVVNQYFSQDRWIYSGAITVISNTYHRAKCLIVLFIIAPAAGNCEAHENCNNGGDNYLNNSLFHNCLLSSPKNVGGLLNQY